VVALECPVVAIIRLVGTSLPSIDAYSPALRLQFVGEVILVALGRSGIWVSGASVSEVEKRFVVGAFGDSVASIIGIVAGEVVDVKVFFGGGVSDGFEPLEVWGMIRHAVPDGSRPGMFLGGKMRGA